MTPHAPIRTVAPAALPVSVADAKAWLWVDHNSHDTLIESLIATATEYLDGFHGVLGRAIINQTWRQDFHDWSPKLRLPFPDVSSTGMTVAYSDASNVEQTVSASLYQLLQDARGSYLRFSDDFTDPALYDDRDDPVRVTFVAGFGANSIHVPQSLRGAILTHVAHLYANREAVAAGDMKPVPLSHAALIAPWRRRTV